MWKVKIIRISDDCPYFNENESEINQCSHDDNPTYWRGLMGICDEEFCPIKVGEIDANK